MTSKNWIVIIIFTLLVCPAMAQVSLVRNGKSTSRIILTSESAENQQAAVLLQDFVKRISDVKLPIATQTPVKKGDVLIGNSGDNAKFVSPEITEDGFRIKTDRGVLSIVSGGGKGVIYGVVTLLEGLGVNYFGAHEFTYPSLTNIAFNETDKIDNPAFRYRQTQFYALQDDYNDPTYKLWNRLEEPKEIFAGGYWVHTFRWLLSGDEYGTTHPEYFAYYNGKRHPGNASQLCLSNPAVFEIISNRVDSIFKADPSRTIISISQNDGNYTNCACEKCKAIDTHEESLSGSLITFLNKLATRFPDKEFSTLAYLYSVKPPKHIRPLPNVNIMLCDIDCKREVSLTENASGQDFVSNMQGWSKISNNIFMWDYGINFDNYLSPFPNFHILQDNIKLFKHNSVTMHFSQIGGVSQGCDFAELRAYLVAKLMWNPDANVDSLMHNFLNGYYGKAAPYIYNYIKVMEGAIIASGQPLWIYDSPISHKNGMLCPALIRRYNILFDSAEKAVADDSVLLHRIYRARLPLQYSQLEIFRTQRNTNITEVTALLNLFEKRIADLKVISLNENNNTTTEYCSLYRQRYMPQKESSIALGAKVTLLNEPSGKYCEIGNTALTDGLFGGSSFVESWVGWEGKDASFIIDMGSQKEFSTIDADFLYQQSQWVLAPIEVTYSYSTDGTTYTALPKNTVTEERERNVKFISVRSESATSIKAQYIKVEIVGSKECPSWHPGAGHKSWFFIDEVRVL